jgi:hypothetical protein
MMIAILDDNPDYGWDGRIPCDLFFWVMIDILDTNPASGWDGMGWDGMEGYLGDLFS